MSTVNIIVIIALLGLLILRLKPIKGIRNITTTELKSELGDQNKQYIDVRTTGEFKSRSIKGFKNIPLDQISNKATILSKDKEVVVICQSGMRSARAATILKGLGFQKITNVKGGMSSWR